MAKRKPDNIDKDLAMAEKLGYGPHYGAYKVDYPNTREVEPEPEIVPATPDTKVYDYDAICPICGKTFEKTHALQMYCCQECKDFAKKKSDRARYDKKHGALSSRICPTCKREFLPVHRSQKYCCDKCQKKRTRSA